MKVLTLAHKNDTYNFRVGQPIALTWSGNQLMPLSRWRAWLRRAWYRLTSPIRRRSVVIAVDADCGTVTVAADRRWYRFL